MSKIPEPEIAHLKTLPVKPMVESEKDRDSTSTKVQDDNAVASFQFVSSLQPDEPVVTRKELWSYYCQSSLSLTSSSLKSSIQCITTATMYVTVDAFILY